MFCIKCGTEIPEEAEFCPKCGSAVEKSIIPSEPPNEKINPEVFMHDSDRKALKAMKAVPGFGLLVKTIMKLFNEYTLRFDNLSTNIRIDENQLPEYHKMLVEICEKLGIDVPEMYLKLDVNPNAYTMGDTKPFVVLTSGLLEHFPSEVIQTVIAHECGHIACHHVLYHTMGDLIIKHAHLLPLSGINLALPPLQLAFAYWMRCSEFSADRAAIFYDGSADKLINMCIGFSGYGKNISQDIDIETFIKQAEDYNSMVNDSKFNKLMEFILFKDNDHPLNAVRAYEAREWVNTQAFKDIVSKY